jgi:hypothetical protein
MSSIDQITSLLESISFEEKLTLIERLAATVRKEGGGKAASKRKSKATSEGSDVKPKRKSSPGTLAWQAFVKHNKTTRADAFEGITLEKDKLVIMKGIRAEDEVAYQTFITAWKKDYAAKADTSSSSDTETDVVVAVPTPVVAPVMSPKEKIAAAKANASLKKEVKVEVKKEAKVGVKKEVKKAASKKVEVKKEESTQLPILTLEDVDYWHEPSTNGLWRKETDTFSCNNWVGYYQPGNEEEPIRYTNAFTEA